MRAPVGGCPSLEEVEKALQGSPFKLMTVTHVDTSTGVLTDVQELAALARCYEILWSMGFARWPVRLYRWPNGALTWL